MDLDLSGGAGETQFVRTDVQKFYSWFATWYDPFRRLWVLATSRQAERDLDSLFLRYVTPETAILDLGCGTGVNMSRLLRLGLRFREYKGVDFTESMLARARKNFGHVPDATFSSGDVTALEDDGRRYDVIVSTYVLSHLRRPAAFVHDAQKFLQPGGHLLLVFYSRPSWWVSFWLVPLGNVLLRADAVRRSEIASFEHVRTRKAYFAGAVTLVEIAASAGGVAADDPGPVAEKGEPPHPSSNTVFTFSGPY